MWLIFNLKKEFRKIKDIFKKRDKEITTNSQSIDRLKEDFNNNSLKITDNSLKIARLEGILSVLLSKSQVSVSQNIKKSQGKIETKMINRIRRSKKAIVVSEINKLKDNHSVIEMYEDIVLNKGLCSKASFYRYIASLNSLKIKETKTELRH